MQLYPKVWIRLLQTRLAGLLRSLKVLLILCLISATAAGAAPPLETYLQTRDRAIQALDREPDDNSDKEDRAALDELQKQLTGLIGPVELQGFSPKARINLETLQNQQMGFGLLDALIYSSSDKKTQAYCHDATAAQSLDQRSPELVERRGYPSGSGDRSQI
jgi:hypothetical protein